MILFLINFFDLLFALLALAIIARALLSWIAIDPYHPVAVFLNQITEPILAPLRRYIPLIGMMDITPIVALILLQILRVLVHDVLINLYFP